MSGIYRGVYISLADIQNTINWYTGCQLSLLHYYHIWMNEPIALFDTSQSTAQQRKILYIVRVITSRGHRGHQSERKKTETNPRGTQYVFSFVPSGLSTPKCINALSVRLYRSIPFSLPIHICWAESSNIHVIKFPERDVVSCSLCKKLMVLIPSYIVSPLWVPIHI